VTAPQSHKELIRTEFTRQAITYPANASIADPNRVMRLVQAVNPAAEARVLEVASGPGYVALGFATVCAEVVGIDLTPALVAKAEQLQQERGLLNVRFQLGDAEQLPFADGEFDVVVCRLAFHHFPEPARVLGEMVRACRFNGTVAVEDLITSENPTRAEYQNDFERLRDPSHTRALPLSELVQLFAAAGLEVETVQTDALVPAVEDWLANAKTPSDKGPVVRALIERDGEEDLSGTRPFRREGALYFTQRTAAVVGRRLRARD
jgi:SAM-dependent methyltransferase